MKGQKHTTRGHRLGSQWFLPLISSITLNGFQSEVPLEVMRSLSAEVFEPKCDVRGMAEPAERVPAMDGAAGALKPPEQCVDFRAGCC